MTFDPYSALAMLPLIYTGHVSATIHMTGLSQSCLRMDIFVPGHCLTCSQQKHFPFILLLHLQHVASASKTFIHLTEPPQF